MRKRIFMLLALICAVVLLSGIAMAGNTDRVSVADDESESNGLSTKMSMSNDGRFVVFNSYASNLIGTGNDTNGAVDVFVRDTVNGTTVRVSVTNAGNESNGNSYINGLHSISDDGRFIVFSSLATNLNGTDGNGFLDVFLHDRDSNGDGTFGDTTTIRVSSDTSGGDANGLSDWASISGDGKYIVYMSKAMDLVSDITFTGNVYHIYLYDRIAGTTTYIDRSAAGGVSNNQSTYPSIDDNGRFITFSSYATDIVPDGGDTNNFVDVFLADRDSNGDGTFGDTSITRVNVDNSGNESNGPVLNNPDVSDNGRFIVFCSQATNLDSADTDAYADIYLHDRDSNGDGTFGDISTTLVSVDSNGNKAFYGAIDASISADGNLIAFRAVDPLSSLDTNSASDAYIRNVSSGTTERASLADDGSESNDWIQYPVISDNGNAVAFYTYASNLIGEGNDTNGKLDVFVRTPEASLDSDPSVFSDCDETNADRYPDNPEIVSDGVDQDCNGYDLTIDITKANYKSAQSQLTVWATSDNGSSANLKLDVPGYSTVDMSWNNNKWEYTMTGVTTDPGSVTVWGFEGAVTEQTN